MSAAAYPLEYEYEQLPEAESTDQRSPMWLYFFIAVLLGFQIALVIPGSGSLRVVWRIGGYAASLFLLLALSGRGIPAPAAKWAKLALVVVFVSILHPDTNSLLSGFAAACLYMATLAPLFWVPRIRMNMETLRRVILFFWLFHSASSFFGVLQVYHPGQYMPNIGAVSIHGGSEAYEKGYTSALSFTLPNGERVFRPMGLTDSPGGAGISGMYTAVLGIALLLYVRRKILMVGICGSIALGLFCVYMCQIRTLFVMTAVSVVAFLIAYARSGGMARTLRIAAVLAFVVAASFIWAVVKGGDAVTGRLGSLFAESPTEVYGTNRGFFLNQFFTWAIPSFPLGAGLGRWGMINAYFGDQTKEGLWSEIQLSAWVYDGGWAMLLLYPAAILVTLLSAWKIARGVLREKFGAWGSLLFAYSLGGAAMTLDFPFFAAQAGMEFWFLNAILFTAYQTELARSSALPMLAQNALEQPTDGYPMELAQ